MDGNSWYNTYKQCHKQLKEFSFTSAGKCKYILCAVSSKG